MRMPRQLRKLTSPKAVAFFLIALFIISIIAYGILYRL